MDFLDPKKKRNQKIRLTIGHALMALLVFIGTYLLVFRAYGYDFDTKTGEVIQEGLVYIDSTPGGANISINGRANGQQTGTRLSLQEGKYSLELTRDGYSPWRRDFELQGGEVARYDYAFLFPIKPDTGEVQTFSAKPDFVTQSPDRRWILLAEKGKLNNMTLYDLNRRTDDQPNTTSLTFPSGLFAEAPGKHVLKLVEWSTDNRHILVRHDFRGGREFIVLDRENAAESYNVNRTLNRDPDKVTLFDKKFDRLLIYDAKSKRLSRADIDDRPNISTIASNVISYKSHGDDTVLLSHIDPKDKTKAQIIMRQDGKDYLVRRIPTASDIPLDIARYDNSWYVIFGVQSEERAYIYRDPAAFITNNPADLRSIRAFVLKSEGRIDEVSFSQNARFIMAASGRHFSVYDAEMEKHYSYGLGLKPDKSAKPVWMDGHRIVTSTGERILIFDYDGTNKHTLIKADPAMPVMFDRDYEELYSLGSVGKNEYSLSLTELRTTADR
ncbi:MAG TPA: PEGA domain-containing protein [Candidatus Saccharimonadales bacterium]|nr:PEGA domain-containing protein [Candidatus Saccharimonadales bacterium]